MQQLLNKGATIYDPGAVYIDPAVDIDRLAGREVTIYPGVRIFGADTFIGEGAQIGKEGPVTIEGCYVGPKVSLKGGFFSGAVFLAGAACGSGAHVRPGTILEEYAGIAHSVGLKQTILFPYVTLGSLINFCDCLMAGGTGPKNHSEVGSSYIHFNFTPNQDKVTPSLIGDVPRGVMLNQSPIFLGGQGGMVGPCRLAYGTVVAAGTLCRHDQLKENHLVYGAKPQAGTMPYKPGNYLNLKRILEQNLNFIGNLIALKQWYLQIRARFTGPELPVALLNGLEKTVSAGIAERIQQLGKLSTKLDPSDSGNHLHLAFAGRWADVEGRFLKVKAYAGDPDLAGRFSDIIDEQIKRRGRSYIEVIQSLDADQSAIGTQWMTGIVESVNSQVMDVLLSV
ncbi:MAG: hypothetical protein HKP58_02700 [Desulfatitalea sp.]|nr:hypothetical protein [Desulfatitalea sp.]